MAEAKVAEVLLGAILEEAVSKANSFASRQISRIWNFKKELKGLGASLEMVEAFLKDAEEKQTKGEAVKLWLQGLEEVAHEAADVLDEFDYEIRRRELTRRNHQIRRTVLDFLSPNNSIIFRLKMAKKIKDILETLHGLNEKASSYGLQQGATVHVPLVPRILHEGMFSVMDDLTIVGRENDVSKVVDLLVNPKDKQDVSVVPIVGMAGLGKTALAKLVYHDLSVKRHFDVKSWVCVSDDFNVERILGAMFEQLTGDTQTLITVDAMITKLKEKIEQAKGEKDQIKYLLVLDDVWDVKKWEYLKRCLKGISANGGNGVIVTTRKEDVASTVQALSDQRHQPRRLEDEECWSIIKQRALTSSPMSHDLEPIGKEIAKQCRGVPLLAKVIGGTMSKDRSRRAWLEIQKSGVWGSPDSVLEVESVLKLSFDRLPHPSLKKCFAYCAMFPEHYCFVKEELIQLWMAEGFLGSSMAAVDTGDKYLNELLSNSLFQDVEKDKFGNILTLKMHDSLHDLSLSVSKFDTLFLKENSTLASNECSHIRHLNVGCDGESLPEILTAVAPKLYSLFSEINVFKKLSKSFTKSFTRLRVLKFVGAANICELPDSLGELKHLRYLDVSRTSIKALPKSATELYHLQTLRLLGLRRLTFPDGLEKLISLKHLYFDRKELQPVNIGNLTCLQTLPIFFVGSERGRSIKELGSLNELRGKLEIRQLEGARDKQEAKGANLHRKGKLCKVIFAFEGSDCGSGGYNSEEVMEGLQPHSNLQSLTVRGYRGESFPSWMLRPVGDSNTGLFLLDNLMELNFYDCINCESLPPLGQLHNLQYLQLINLKKVKRMGNEFCCNEGVDGKNKVIKVFRALKEFTLSRMASLEEWTAMAVGKTIMFPCLERLKIEDCPLLKSVPLTGQFLHCNKLEVLAITGGCSSLEKLRILFCPKLSKIGDGLSTSTCLKEFNLKSCSNLSSIPNLEGFSSLQYLSVQWCFKLEVLPITGGCSSLEKLHIFKCENLSKIGDGLSTSTCLKELHLEDCPNLSSIPNLEGFSSLQFLSVQSCFKLEVLPITGGCSSLEKLRILFCPKLSKIGDGLFTSTSLKELRLEGCPNLSSIPNLEGFSSLQFLSVQRCFKLEVLPITGGRSSLEKLRIVNCEKLSKIGDGLSTSTCLKDLLLGGCPNLSSIPNLEGFSSLQFLSVQSCFKLEVLPITGGCSSLEKLGIFSCEKLSKIGDGLSTSTCLKELCLKNCPNLSSIPNLEGFSSLQYLLVDGCDKLESFPLKAPLSSLKKLMIRDCPNLKPIPSLDGLSSLTELEFKKVGEEWSRLLPNMLQSNVSLCSLTILNLPDPTWIQDESLDRLDCLRELAIGGFLEELQEFPWPSSIQYLSASLRDLKLIGWEKLKSLPHQLQFFTALEKLVIKGFRGIEAFPEWLGNLSSLKDLRILYCNKLMYLPPVDVMRSLSELRRIEILGCPQLETRCKRKSGTEWSKISHIPYIHVNSGLSTHEISEFSLDVKGDADRAGVRVNCSPFQH
ncbi:disease resistance protein RGA2-like [Gossypium australe]|uniref:Disease resistance protein RGA2-like n=1 Tax=Gossypium australe TaxID=47621 RepID=A0A5B6UHY2_9ROSI|nr:disease resistance protein RGA2-like [Gossypium australe]